MIILRRFILFGVAFVVAVAFMASCSGPEEKKIRFYNKGKALYEKEDYTKAALELKNAVQIDPEFVAGYHLLGLVAVKTGDINGAIGNFSKAVELNPRSWDDQVQLGDLLLRSCKADEAMAKAELVLQGDANHEDALILKGSTLLAKKNTDDALRFLRNVVGSKIHKPDGYLLLNFACQQKGDVQNAENILRKGIKANEKSVPLHLALIDIALKKKQMDEAIRLTRKIIRIEPNVLQHRLALAGMLWDSGKKSQSVNILKAIVSDKPKEEERWIQVAGFYVARNKPAEAEQKLKEGIRKNAKSFSIRFALVGSLVLNNSSGQAISILEDCLALEKNPANQYIIQTKNTMAKIYLARKDIDKAELYVDEVIKVSPKNLDANYIKGIIHLQKREEMQAVSSFRVVVDENTQFVPGYIGLADAHLLNKETNIAFDTVRDALISMPNSRDLLKALARLYITQRNFKDAEVQYRKILDSNPNDPDALADLGDLFQAAGDFERAEKEYGEIKKQAPKLPLGYMKLSACYLARRKWDKAMAELEQVLQIHPDLWTAANDLAFLLADHGRGEKDLGRALVLAKKAQSLNPVNPTLSDTLGWVHYQRGEIKPAIEWLENARAISPRDPMINYHLGIAYNQEKNPGKAKECLQFALTSKADFSGREQAEKVMEGMR